MARKLIARGLIVAAIAAAGTTAAAGIAAADTPQQGPGGKPGVGCPVEDEHGNVTYVPVGSQVGLFHCESDGEWHFGWATTGMVASKPSAPTVSRTLR